MSKIYLIVRNDIDQPHAVLGACHGMAAFMLKFRDSASVMLWAKESFRKVLCSASKEEFDKVKEFLKQHEGQKYFIPYVVMTESACHGEETAIVAGPFDSNTPIEIKNIFADLNLWNNQSK